MPLITLCSCCGWLVQLYVCKILEPARQQSTCTSRNENERAMLYEILLLLHCRVSRKKLFSRRSAAVPSFFSVAYCRYTPITSFSSSDSEVGSCQFKGHAPGGPNQSFSSGRYFTWEPISSDWHFAKVRRRYKHFSVQVSGVVITSLAVQMASASRRTFFVMVTVRVKMVQTRRTAHVLPPCFPVKGEAVF